MSRIVLVALLLVLSGGMNACSPSGPPLLISDVREIPDPPPFEIEEWLIHAEGVILHPSLLSPEELEVGETLRFVTMEGQEVNFRIDVLEAQGAFLNLRGRTEEADDGVMLLTIGEQGVWGSIQLYDPSERYYIRYFEEADLHVLMLVDPEAEDILPGIEAEAP